MNLEKVKNATSLKGAIQALSPEQIRLLQGTVISEDPLQIQAAGDDKLIIPEALLIVPEWLTDHKYPAYIETTAYQTSPMTEVEDSAPFTHSVCQCELCAGHTCPSHMYKQSWIIVKNHLRVGDTVDMLALGGGRKYYILDRRGDNSCRLL